MSSAFRGAAAATAAALTGPNSGHNSVQSQDVQAMDKEILLSVETNYRRGAAGNNRGGFCGFLRRTGASLSRKFHSITDSARSAARTGIRKFRYYFDNSPSARVIRLAGRKNFPFHHVLDQMKMQEIDINCLNTRGETILISAVKGGNHSVVRDALRSGADRSMVDNEDRTAFWYAADRGDSEALRILLETKPAEQQDLEMFINRFINQQDKNGETALHRAVERQTIDVVKQLIAAGASPWIIDKNGVWPLTKALSTENVDVVRSLGLFWKERVLVFDLKDEFLNKDLVFRVSELPKWIYRCVKEGSSLSKAVQECSKVFKEAEVHSKA